MNFINLIWLSCVHWHKTCFLTKRKKHRRLRILITNFLHDKVNHYDRLCELIIVAYLIKVSVYVCVFKLLVRSTAGGLIERVFRWWARCQYFCAHCELVRGKAVGLAAELPSGSSIMPKMCAVTCQRLTGQFIFNSVTKWVFACYPISSIVVSRVTQPWREIVFLELCYFFMMQFLRLGLCSLVKSSKLLCLLWCRSRKMLLFRIICCCCSLHPLFLDEKPDWAANSPVMAHVQLLSD